MIASNPAVSPPDTCNEGTDITSPLPLKNDPSTTPVTAARKLPHNWSDMEPQDKITWLGTKHDENTNNNIKNNQTWALYCARSARLARFFGIIFFFIDSIKNDVQKRAKSTDDSKLLVAFINVVKSLEASVAPYTNTLLTNCQEIMRDGALPVSRTILPYTVAQEINALESSETNSPYNDSEGQDPMEWVMELNHTALDSSEVSDERIMTYFKACQKTLNCLSRARSLHVIHPDTTDATWSTLLKAAADAMEIFVNIWSEPITQST